MIYSVKSNKPTFKNIDFTRGFNVILAERTKESNKKDSRNSLGKSTLIEIIHFCLGADRGETLRKKEMEGWAFTLELDLAGRKYAVTKNTSAKSKVFIEGDCSGWPILPDIDKKTGSKVISNADWKRVLGVFMFGLQLNYEERKYVPTFRSLVSYFARRNGKSGAFLEPFQQYKAQQEWDKQVNNAFLLELGWDYASKWQVLKDREKILAQIKQEAQVGLLTNIMGSIGELEANKIRLEAQAKQEEAHLKIFKVHPQYSKIETEANELTKKIHDLVNESINEKRLLEYYEASSSDEVEANSDAVAKIYEEAGLVLPNLVTKRLEDVLSFHKQVAANRKDFLRVEINRIKVNIVAREQQKQDLSTKRAELMQVLQEHGALDEYTQLQNNHQKTIAELKDFNIRIENLRKFEQGKSAVIVEMELLQQQASTDLSERKAQKERAVLFFNDNSEVLYNAPGALSIDVSKTGLKFKVSIQGSGGTGKTNMEIFCYDLMLSQIWSEKEITPGFLIHDSILFADVDERQKALALELAAKESERLGFQYICTMNSDSIPKGDFSQNFKFDKYVRKTFTDATDDGGLLGVKF